MNNRKPVSTFCALALALAVTVTWPSASWAEEAASPAPVAPAAAPAAAAPPAVTPPATTSLADAVAAATASAKATAAAAAPAKPAEPSPVAKKAYELLLAALQSGKYQKFIAMGDDELKASVRETPFDAVTEVYAARLTKGFDASYFGDMKKNGGELYFWKLVFKDGSDDLLVQISIKKEKLNNFFLL